MKKNRANCPFDHHEDLKRENLDYSPYWSCRKELKIVFLCWDEWSKSNRSETKKIFAVEVVTKRMKTKIKFDQTGKKNDRRRRKMAPTYGQRQRVKKRFLTKFFIEILFSNRINNDSSWESMDFFWLLPFLSSFRCRSIGDFSKNGPFGLITRWLGFVG